MHAHTHDVETLHRQCWGKLPRDQVEYIMTFPKHTQIHLELNQTEPKHTHTSQHCYITTITNVANPHMSDSRGAVCPEQ